MMPSRLHRLLRKALRRVKGLGGLPADPTTILREKFPEHDFGRGTYGDLILRQWGEGAILKIGNFCSIAAGVQIFLGGEHRPDWVTTYPFNVLWPEVRGYRGHPKSKGNVIIGNDVWIGAESVILSGVTIGNGAVVGARAVISRSVAPYSIVVGNPARVNRLRFGESTIAQLEAVKWWDWPDEVLLHAMPDLLSGDLSTFLDRASSGHYVKRAGQAN